MASAPRPNKVYLSGENPVITLRDTPGGSTTVTQVSFWRIHWSPVGSRTRVLRDVRRREVAGRDAGGDLRQQGAARLPDQRRDRHVSTRRISNGHSRPSAAERSRSAAIRSRSGARAVCRTNTRWSWSGGICASPGWWTSCRAAGRRIRSASRICRIPAGSARRADQRHAGAGGVGAGRDVSGVRGDVDQVRRLTEVMRLGGRRSQMPTVSIAV